MAAAGLAARVPAAVYAACGCFVAACVSTPVVKSYVKAIKAANLQASGLNGRCWPRRSRAGGCLRCVRLLCRCLCEYAGGQELCESHKSGTVASLRPQWPLQASPLACRRLFTLRAAALSLPV